MLLRFAVASLFSSAALLAACAPPQDAPPAGAAAGEDAGLEAVRSAVVKAIPGMAAEDVHPTAVAGLYELRQSGQYGYVTGDGRFLIDGDLIDLATRANLTENKRKQDRVTRLASLGAENLIVFAPEDGKTRHTVTVFTDIDCGYCRKLHREVGEYNALGIAIQYAFYPRSGPNTPSFKKAEKVWCSADRHEALTLAKQGVEFAGEPGCENPVAREYQLGAELGLRGTPMMILPDGEVVNGYVPAAALAERLTQSEQG
jgi:thiol:disulfide interchange protein DsbC